MSAMLALSGVDASKLTQLIGRGMVTNQNGEIEIMDDVITSTHEGTSDIIDYNPTHILSSLSYIGVSECVEMGGAFASFLPGITMTLTKVMTSDIKVGSSVTVLALLTWAHYVAMVMDDVQISEQQQNLEVQYEKRKERERERGRVHNMQCETDFFDTWCMCCQCIGGMGVKLFE